MSREGGVQNFSVVIGDRIAEKNIAWTAPRAGTASEGIMPLSDEDGAALIAELEKEKKDLELQKREFEAELSWFQYETELEWLQYEAWLQSENLQMPMLPLLEGPEQLAPTTVALAVEAPAAEVMADTRVFPDTAAPDASVERAAIKRTSAAGPSSTICGERRAFRYYKSSGNGSNSNSSNSSKSSGNGSSSSSNDTTSNHDSWWEAIYVGAILRPFDPGKRCRRSARRRKAVLGMDLPFDRGKSWGRMQHGG